MKAIIAVMLALLISAVSALSQKQHAGLAKKAKSMPARSGAYKPKDIQIDKPAYVRILNAYTSIQDDLALSGEKFSVSFGDTVLVIATHKQMYLIEKGGARGYIEKSWLTANREEINYIKNIDKIPISTSLVFVDEHGLPRVQGFSEYQMSVSPFSNQASSGGLSLSRVGNAVFVDESMFSRYAVDSTFFPMLVCNNRNVFKASEHVMYYCTTMSNGSCFACIDLTTLSFCKRRK
jgi:hypothetical protein